MRQAAAKNRRKNRTVIPDMLDQRVESRAESLLRGIHHVPKIIIVELADPACLHSHPREPGCQRLPETAGATIGASRFHHHDGACGARGDMPSVRSDLL